MNRLVGVVPGAVFGGAVVGAAPAESNGQALADPILTVLSELFQTLDEPERSACAELLLQRDDLNKSSRAFIERQAAKAHKSLVDAHEAIKRECVAQEKVIQELKNKIIELKQELQRKKHDTSRAETRFFDAQQARENLSRFAARSELASADAALAKAESEFQAARANEAPYQTQSTRCRLSRYRAPAKHSRN